MNKAKYGKRIVVELPQELISIIPCANNAIRAFILGNLGEISRPALNKGKNAALRLSKTTLELINYKRRSWRWTKREVIVAALTLATAKGYFVLDNEATLREIDEREARYEQNRKIQKM
ncbi:MAG: hypothetical protein LBI57_05005 [Helicobacteraceae bacterium]|jgi:hypothetical protein|nr:hypothetical protein [Helicobacteraceae bacterium]